MGSISNFTPSFFTSVSPSFMTSSNVKPYWKPEQPPPETNTPQHQIGVPFFVDQFLDLQGRSFGEHQRIGHFEVIKLRFCAHVREFLSFAFVVGQCTSPTCAVKYYGRAVRIHSAGWREPFDDFHGIDLRRPSIATIEASTSDPLVKANPARSSPAAETRTVERAQGIFHTAEPISHAPGRGTACDTW